MGHDSSEYREVEDTLGIYRMGLHEEVVRPT